VSALPSSKVITALDGATVSVFVGAGVSVWALIVTAKRKNDAHKNNAFFIFVLIYFELQIYFNYNLNTFKIR
jgi:hypothetical protein